MKQLLAVTVGDYKVEITAEPHEASILFTAKCGESAAFGHMTMPTKHDHSEAQFQKDVSDFTERLAHEVAGKERARTLKSKFFAAR